jgi:hypothetical protein
MVKFQFPFQKLTFHILFSVTTAQVLDEEMESREMLSEEMIQREKAKVIKLARKRQKASQSV